MFRKLEGSDELISCFLWCARDKIKIINLPLVAQTGTQIFYAKKETTSLFPFNLHV